MVLAAATALAVPRGFLDERVAYIGPRDNCKFGELFEVGKPFAMTDDTAVVVTMRSSVAGHASFFWHYDVKDRAENAGNGVGFDIEGGGRWRTYVLRPKSPAGGKGVVSSARLYAYPANEPNASVAVKSIEFARRGVAPFDSAKADGVVFRMKSDEFKYLSLNWFAKGGAADAVPFYMGFTTIPDGREHTYWLDLKNTMDRMTFGRPHWFGTIEGFCVRANLEKKEFVPDGFRFVRGIPDLPADPVIRQVFAEDAIPRAGRPLPIEIVVRNYGTQPAEGMRFALENLPDGVRVLDERDLAPEGVVAPSAGYDYIRDDYMPNGLPNERRFRITLSDPGRAVEFVSKLTLTAANGARSEKDLFVKVLPSLNLAPQAYPAEPKPLDTGDIEVGVFLFPGWKRHQFYPAWDAMPERKPVLGWYDDSLPEVRDWQIKWLVENGVSYAFVDWYWNEENGPSVGNYWFEGIAKARYRKYLKYAALWCNEGAYRHSVKDQEMVTKYWIDNFFSDPQYLKIDGKPVVGMWALNMDRALGPDGAKSLIAVSQKMAREAGYPGIYFVSMHGSVEKPEVFRHLKEVGVSASFEYHYAAFRKMVHGYVDGTIDYSVVADDSPRHWRAIRDACDLPMFPSVSTGTGNLPWHGDRGKETVGMSPAAFARICRDAKRFGEETGMKRILLGPLDEWCEGEIGYPNAEHGFGILEAVRETFAKKPPEGFPLNYTPQDVGLGPYTKASP